MYELTYPIEAAPAAAKSEAALSAPLSLEIVIIGALLTLLQIADGVLTGIGVSYFGTEIEGNPALRYLLESIGPVAGLAIVKIFAIGIVFALCRIAQRAHWVKLALKGVIVVYLFAAIIPWSYILYTYTS